MARLIALEVIRGYSLVIIFVGHYFLLFIPNFMGVYEGENVLAHMRINAPVVGRILFQLLTPVNGSPLFCLFNASAANDIFFFIAAYIQATQHFAKRDCQQLFPTIWLVFIKRYARLLGPVLVATLIAYFSLANGLYYCETAGEICGSEVLRTYGRLTPHMSEKTPADPTDPNLFDAVVEGSILTFMRGDTSYLRSMWFIHYILFGSVVTTFICFLLSNLQKKGLHLVILSAFLCCLSIVFSLTSYYYLYFITGIVLAYAHTNCPGTFKMSSTWKSVIVTVAIVYSFGFFFPIGFYSWLDPFVTTKSSLLRFRSYFYNVGCCLLVHFCIKHEKTSELLDRVGSKVVKYIGRLYMGIYFLSNQIDGTLCSYLFLVCHDYKCFSTNFLCLAVMFIVRLFVHVVCAHLFFHFDQWWNSVVTNLLKHKSFPLNFKLKK